MRVERVTGPRRTAGPGGFQRQGLWSIQGNLGRCHKGSEITFNSQKKSIPIPVQRRSPSCPTPSTARSAAAPENPRLLHRTTPAGAIYLSGSHTWAVFQDLVPLDGEPSPGQLFDFEDWLAFSKRYGFNFLRLWSREAAYQRGRRGVELGQYLPSRYLEANPGRAPGELPKYDLDRLNPAYFERLRDRVIRAGEQGHLRLGHALRGMDRQPLHGRPLRRPPLQPAEQRKRRRRRSRRPRPSRRN